VTGSPEFRINRKNWSLMKLVLHRTKELDGGVVNRVHG
jgi:hypothetical protein